MEIFQIYLQSLEYKNKINKININQQELYKINTKLTNTKIIIFVILVIVNIRIVEKCQWTYKIILVNNYQCSNLAILIWILTKINFRS